MPLKARRDSTGASPSGSLLALGDPLILVPSPSQHGDETETERGRASDDAGPHPARLLYSEREVRGIARHFPDAVVELGAAATEESIKRRSPDFRFLHISSHGTIQEAVPLYSGLALAADPAGREDGFLHAYEVLSIPLSCDLVTLSACETGLGRLYGGEGLIGLTRSFLYAGAHQVLVSLWSVNDASTAILMERFYENLSRGVGVDEALQSAKRSLRHTVALGGEGHPMAYAHPFFWAPFVLVGPPGQAGTP